MTPEQLAAMLARAVPEMRWTVDGMWVEGQPLGVRAIYYAGSITLEWCGLSALVHTRASNTNAPRPEPIVCDDIVRGVGGMLLDVAGPPQMQALLADARATWARSLYARAEVLRCEVIAAERGTAMKDAAEAYNEAVTALRSAQAHLEAVQDG